MLKLKIILAIGSISFFVYQNIKSRNSIAVNSNENFTNEYNNLFLNEFWNNFWNQFINGWSDLSNWNWIQYSSIFVGIIFIIFLIYSLL